MINILQNQIPAENKILRAICKEVASSEFGTSELKEEIHKMTQAMLQEIDGVALAAPQIGINKRIFVVNKDLGYDKDAKWRPEVFINPVIVKASKKYLEQHEGCLSVRGFYGWTWRAKNVTVEACDINGDKFTFGAGGLIAHIIQHEFDHLEGILFVDHGFDIEEDKDWKQKLDQYVKSK
jgi:peptide deformylase